MSLPFGFVYVERMLEHDCPYDNTMAERPERMEAIYQRLKHDGLLDHAVQIPARLATDDELRLNHPDELLRELEALKTVEECEDFCKDKEIVWLAPQTEQAARLAAGSSVDLVKANLENRIGNGFAIVRPPGHHAYGKTPLGYCIFNNVAVAAKVAVEKLGVKRVAIIDFDYHPGNGTFYSVKDDERILLVSIHAYHHAAFWPFDTTFDYDTPGNQIFVPLNAAMNSEGDYLGIFDHLLVPAIRDFDPELVFFSAGFDAAYYDIMSIMGQGVKAHGYGHMVRAMCELYPNKVLSILEGGYFKHSYVECAAMMVRALQNLPLPRISHPRRISAPLAETIWNNLLHHRKRFPSCAAWLEKLQNNQKKQGLTAFTQSPRLNLGAGVRTMWEAVKAAKAVRTREWFPEMSEEDTKKHIEMIDAYIQEYDYEHAQEPLSEDFLLNQLLWDDTSRAEAFVKAAPSCLNFVKDFEDFVQGKKDHMMICDRVLYDEALRDGRAKVTIEDFAKRI